MPSLPRLERLWFRPSSRPKRTIKAAAFGSINAIVWFITRATQDVQVAIAREKQVKRWRREKKINLIEKLNPRWQDLSEKWGRKCAFARQSLGKIP